MLNLHAALRRQAKTVREIWADMFLDGSQAFTFTSSNGSQSAIETLILVGEVGGTMTCSLASTIVRVMVPVGVGRGIESLVRKAAVLTELGCWLAMRWRGTIPNGVGGASTV
ncbi:hypothetical protein GQ607_014523 [Colletotrichum asianum]|uniref:Uncharacterized protein n=1 Tax=Colletotrichum asianum TaxID=702518 RepID=A0A8H3VXC3_9PEZI|nr:hypothetical protein GQ607_014523 [Colletotrichum asianum]